MVYDPDARLRKALIRLAHENPDGIRAHLLPLVKQAALMDTWGKSMDAARRSFTEEVLKLAQRHAKDEGFQSIRVAFRGLNGLLTAVTPEGKPVSVRYYWAGGNVMGGDVSLGRYKKTNKIDVTDYSPNEVAALFFFRPTGLIPSSRG